MAALLRAGYRPAMPKAEVSPWTVFHRSLQRAARNQVPLSAAGAREFFRPCRFPVKICYGMRTAWPILLIRPWLRTPLR